MESEKKKKEWKKRKENSLYQSERWPSQLPKESIRIRGESQGKACRSWVSHSGILKNPQWISRGPLESVLFNRGMSKKSAKNVKRMLEPIRKVASPMPRCWPVKGTVSLYWNLTVASPPYPPPNKPFGIFTTDTIITYNLLSALPNKLSRYTVTDYNIWIEESSVFISTVMWARIYDLTAMC